ncbi:GNAT family N-acetyltransferase [Flavobacterium silvaticum]|uniref:GNAT family N-acetyltransferase n=1 Tax=Flavobacterium silvaticum TaxID=1852020 RepID=A0A972FKK4_9FLAO|nr:GNAT family N-acetyltransferase [Flavobacterium silvaticum]NMH27468.1 GNAT family N-acetyltransferase [Flavobacterium silvaticum]
MDVTIKPALQTNVPEITQLMQDFYAIDGYPMDQTKSGALLSEFIKDEKHGGVWLVTKEETTCGYIILTLIFSFEYGGWIGFLDELYIKDEFRGQGIGKVAVDFIISEAKRRQLKLLYLEVEPHNESAQKLYLDKGFKQHKRKLLAWKPG